jgi:hypothetical protein
MPIHSSVCHPPPPITFEKFLRIFVRVCTYIVEIGATPTLVILTILKLRYCNDRLENLLGTRIKMHHLPQLRIQPSRSLCYRK